MFNTGTSIHSGLLVFRAADSKRSTMAPTVVDATSRPENWTTAAEQYQDNVGRMTAYGVTRLVQIVNGVHPFDNQSQVLDIGTGSGAVLQKIYAVAPQVPHLIAGDISPASTSKTNQVRSVLTARQCYSKWTHSGCPM